jgi:uncharacterized protein YfiM (DUF2279 family)
VIALAAAALALAAPPDSTPPRHGTVEPRVASAPDLPADRWLGADKLKHLVLAGFAESTAFAVARVGGMERRAALVTALTAAGGISIGKELVDRRRGGRASVRDLVWDAVGLVAYGAVLARTAR